MYSKVDHPKVARADLLLQQARHALSAGLASVARDKIRQASEALEGVEDGELAGAPVAEPTPPIVRKPLVSISCG